MNLRIAKLSLLSQHLLFRIFGFLFLVNFISFFAFFIFAPHYYREQFIEEDLFMENLSAGLFLLGAMIALLAYFVNRGSDRIIFVVIFSLGIFFFLEEVGFGNRFFDLPMPSIGGGKIDGFHDFFAAGLIKFKQLSSEYQFIFGAVAVTIGIGLFYFGKRFLAKVPEKIRTSTSWQFLILVFLLLAVAIFLDLSLVQHEYLNLTEEILEMNAGLALCFAAIASFQRNK